MKSVSKVNQSLWADSEERFKGKRLEANREFDVAIIGGGFSGLWTAFHLNKLDSKLRIAVFEANEIGFGASGRNGGWASSEYPVSEKTLKKKIGQRSTEMLFTALNDSIDEIGVFASKHAKSAKFTKSGSLYFARNQGQLKRLQEKPESGSWVTAGELQERIRISGALGGRFNSQCAAVQPYNLLQGLAKYLAKRRVAIFEKSWASRTPEGVLVNSFSVTAPVVIQATEVY
ncbi:MAG: NAD(P)/FAD-dependent oxidoreductase, partial [Actinomycetales bacterium]